MRSKTTLKVVSGDSAYARVVNEAATRAARDALASAIEKTNGLVPEAAALLGLHPKTAYRLVSQLGLEGVVDRARRRLPEPEVRPRGRPVPRRFPRRV